MTILKMNQNHIQQLVTIWLSGSKEAHSFIPFEYWEQRTNDMADIYLPQSETYVISMENEVVGFISLVEDYLAAIFVVGHVQGQGFGKRLLQHAQSLRNSLQLKVYEKNSGAISFYHANGFQVIDNILDEETNERELVMMWHSSSNSND